MPSIVKQRLAPEADRFTATNAPTEDIQHDSTSAGDESDAVDIVTDEPTKKKRKRDSGAENELEIDVNLPEPPSKKALRKQKKGSKSKPHPGDEAQTEGEEDTTRKGAISETSSSTKTTKGPAQYSVWIGNLPFSIDKTILSSFLINNSGEAIPKDSITRVNIPAPPNVKATRTSLKPQNKGFAYVDFTSETAFTAALALSETQLGGRNLLIKDAKSFAGRPDKPKPAPGQESSPTTKAASTAAKAGQKKPSRRIFVGNLGFDVLKADLETHFADCGVVENVHMATFEDTGNCKGFAWITFAASAEHGGKLKDGEESATDAVNGFTWVAQEREDESESDERSDSEDAEGKEAKKAKKAKKPMKPKKWYVNRINGRDLRCEFAEDPSTRYNKRFRKDPARQQHQYSPRRLLGDVGDAPVGADGEAAPQQERRHREKGDRKKQVNDFLGDIRPGAPTDPSKRRGKGGPRDDETRYRTGAIAEATGTKVTF